jgi:hypothetical protein
MSSLFLLAIGIMFTAVYTVSGWIATNTLSRTSQVLADKHYCNDWDIHLVFHTVELQNSTTVICKPPPIHLVKSESNTRKGDALTLLKNATRFCLESDQCL